MGFGTTGIQSRLNDWMLQVGRLWVTLGITLVTVVFSVGMTWFANAVFMPHVPVEEWLYISILAPLFISPPICMVVLSLLYQLADARATLVTMSETDPLTGAGNRRFFIDRARLALQDAKTSRVPVSVILLDIDNFKRLNDSYGHAVGDAAIIAVAEVCRQAIRAGDVFCRWGGEEFIVLLPGAGLETAAVLAERLRAAVAAAIVDGVSSGLTISLGVAEWDGSGETLDAVIARADQQLYVAKHLGRNRVAAAAGQSNDAPPLSAARI